MKKKDQLFDVEFVGTIIIDSLYRYFNLKAKYSHIRFITIDRHTNFDYFKYKERTDSIKALLSMSDILHSDL